MSVQRRWLARIVFPAVPAGPLRLAEGARAPAVARRCSPPSGGAPLRLVGVLHGHEGQEGCSPPSWRGSIAVTGWRVTLPDLPRCSPPSRRGSIAVLASHRGDAALRVFPAVLAGPIAVMCSARWPSLSTIVPRRNGGAPLRLRRRAPVLPIRVFPAVLAGLHCGIWHPHLDAYPADGVPRRPGGAPLRYLAPTPRRLPGRRCSPPSWRGSIAVRTRGRRCGRRPARGPRRPGGAPLRRSDPPSRARLRLVGRCRRLRRPGGRSRPGSDRPAARFPARCAARCPRRTPRCGARW